MIKPLGNAMKPIWMKLWIPAAVLFLVLGCSEEPDRKLGGAEGLSEIGTSGAKPGEGSDTKTPPPLTDQQLAEGSSSDIDDHPPITEDQKNVHREIIVPKSVEGKWKAVKILVRDKSDEELSAMQTVNLGSTFQLSDSGITVRAARVFSKFCFGQDPLYVDGQHTGQPGDSSGDHGKWQGTLQQLDVCQVSRFVRIRTSAVQSAVDGFYSQANELTGQLPVAILQRRYRGIDQLLFASVFLKSPAAIRLPDHVR